MKERTDLPSEAEIAADLKRIRTMDWRRPAEFTALRALYDLLPPDTRPQRSDSEATADALTGMLLDLVEQMQLEEEQSPPEFERSYAFAAEQLLRLTTNPELVSPDDIYDTIAQSWKKPSKNGLIPIAAGTFVANHMENVYGELAHRLLTEAEKCEPIVEPSVNRAHAEERVVAAETRTPRRNRRRIAIILGSLAVVSLLAVFVLISLRSDLPERGSIVDAQSGEVSPPNSVEATIPSTSIEGGDIFRACVLAASGACRGNEFARANEPTTVDRGDIVRFAMRLHNPNPLPVSLLRIAANVDIEGASGIAHLTWESPRAASDSVRKLDFDFDGDSAKIQFVDGQHLRLEPIPGSAKLWTSEEPKRLLANLPDGIMDAGGIKLSNVGPPKDCWDCDLEYMRVIRWDMRAT